MHNIEHLMHLHHGNKKIIFISFSCLMISCLSYRTDFQRKRFKNVSHFTKKCNDLEIFRYYKNLCENLCEKYY